MSLRCFASVSENSSGCTYPMGVLTLVYLPWGCTYPGVYLPWGCTYPAGVPTLELYLPWGYTYPRSILTLGVYLPSGAHTIGCTYSGRFADVAPVESPDDYRGRDTDRLALNRDGLTLLGLCRGRRGRDYRWGGCKKLHQ